MTGVQTCALPIWRFVGLLLLAPVSWLTLTLSHALWYRFPLAFTLDGLVVAALEWAVAGAFMARVLASPPATCDTG